MSWRLLGVLLLALVIGAACFALAGLVWWVAMGWRN